MARSRNHFRFMKTPCCAATQRRHTMPPGSKVRFDKNPIYAGYVYILRGISFQAKRISHRFWGESLICLLPARVCNKFVAVSLFSRTAGKNQWTNSSHWIAGKFSRFAPAF
jgi:hypothetical protein